MRGTSKITNANSLYYMARNAATLNKVGSQLSLERSVVNLQDDPMAAVVGMKMTNIIDTVNQYNRNIKLTGIPSLAYSEKQLTNAKTLMDKIKSIAVGGANEATTSEQRSANAIEINELMKQLISIGNANDGTRYVFGGQNTTTPPFTIVNGRYVNYTGNNKKIEIPVDNGTNVAINVTGSDMYGNMTTTIPSRDLNPDVCLSTDRSTKLSDLNGGSGVPKGKILVKYSAYPDGIEVDLSRCDTLEDVKDAIEQATREASRQLDPAKHSWLDTSSLDWHDLQDRYVKVTVNPEHNGISLQEFDLGEPLPEPTKAEQNRGLTYSGGDYAAGKAGVAEGSGGKEVTVFDKTDSKGRPFTVLSVDNYAGNKVAEGLGIKGTANVPNDNPLLADKVMDGFIHGRDLNPRLSESTLLADLEGYNDSVYTFTNGSKPGLTSVKETTQDPNNVFNNWNLTGVTVGGNTGANGELYARAVNRGTAANPEIYVELYTRPVDKATAADLVATGLYQSDQIGGTVILKEANQSGLSGTMGVMLPSSVKEATVDLLVDVGESQTASVHVPAFVEEQFPNGQSRDIFDIASGWNIRGLDKPPAQGYDDNHPASTDLDGNVSVNYRYNADDGYFYVELSRPAFDGQPAKQIATGKLFVGKDLSDPKSPPLEQAVSGRIEFVGSEGFEGVKGSVFIELPMGTRFSGSGAVTGTDSSSPTSVTYPLPNAAGPGTVVLGGMTELGNGMVTDGAEITLAGDTLFKKGQVFTQPVKLPGGGMLPPGTPLDTDTVFTKGVKVAAASFEPGTVLAANQELGVTSIPAGTVIPRGSYYTAGAGFPADGMDMSVTQTNPVTGASETRTTGNVGVIGHDLQATFATIEDFQRAVAEAGVYVTAEIAANGKGLEFSSSLAGAWLTVSEDTDCYEQMGDVNQQLTGLNLNGVVKGVNSDPNGNIHTEVVYYPPDPKNPDGKIKLHDKSGEIIEIDPGYYVRCYSDKSQLDLPYEDRDNTLMVAEGYVAPGKWNTNPVDPSDPSYIPNDPNYFPDNEKVAIAAYDTWLATPPAPGEEFIYRTVPPFIPTGTNHALGFMNNLVLEERNSSGVWGTVNLDYHGSIADAANNLVSDITIKITHTENPDGSKEYHVDYSPNNNDAITVYPGGFRPEGARHTTIQEVDIYNPTPGVNCDYNGTVHGKITANSTSAGGYDVALYRDSSNSVMTAKSDPAKGPDANGTLKLYNVDRHGNYLDKAGKIISNPADVEQYGVVVGTINVDTALTSLEDGTTDTFRLNTGAARNYGQEREENIFSTMNDIIDALHVNDVDALHNLIEDAQRDIDRILAADGDAAARQKRLELLSERHADDIIRYTSTRTSSIGMDDQALTMGILNLQASKNAYQAAMQVSSQIMQMSLLNYL